MRGGGPLPIACAGECSRSDPVATLAEVVYCRLHCPDVYAGVRVISPISSGVGCVDMPSNFGTIIIVPGVPRILSDFHVPRDHLYEPLICLDLGTG